MSCPGSGKLLAMPGAACVSCSATFMGWAYSRSGPLYAPDHPPSEAVALLQEAGVLPGPETPHKQLDLGALQFQIPERHPEPVLRPICECDDPIPDKDVRGTCLRCGRPEV